MELLGVNLEREVLAARDVVLCEVVLDERVLLIVGLRIVVEVHRAETLLVGCLDYVVVVDEPRCANSGREVALRVVELLDFEYVVAETEGNDHLVLNLVNVFEEDCPLIPFAVWHLAVAELVCWVVDHHGVAF